MDDSKSLKDELSGANLGHNHRLSIKQQHRQNIGIKMSPLYLKRMRLKAGFNLFMD